MSIKDRILKRRERFAYERAHWVDADPEESWFYLMTNIQRNNLYSLVLIGPAIFCILFYYFTGITPNIALSYLIIDMIVIFSKRHFAIRRIREDQAYARCEFPYKSRVMGTSEPLKPLKAPYMARNPVKWVFFRLKGQEIPLKI